jgi:heptosyltransferase-3
VQRERTTQRTGPRILILRRDHLGDVLLTLPAVSALRAALPDAYICFLAAAGPCELLRRFPDLDEFGELPPLPSGSLSAAVAPPEHEQMAAVTSLSGRFDLALLFWWDDPWSGELVTKAGIPTRIGFAATGAAPYLTISVPLPPPGHSVSEMLALVDVAVRCVHKQGGRPAAAPPFGRLVPTGTDKRIAAAALRASAAGKHPIVFQLGSSVPLKAWNTRHWGALARQIRRRWRRTVLVTGGPGDGALVATVLREGAGSAQGLAALPLGALAALFGRAALVISIDGGPLHLAALVGARVVGLYGPSDPVKWGPWCPPQRHRIVRVELPCSPCGCRIDPPCAVLADPLCTSGIRVAMVLAAMAELLVESGGRT